MARRVIGSFVYLARVTSGDFFEDKQYYQAIGYLELSTLLKPEQPRTLFDLARAYAGDGNKKRAVETLGQAVAAGYKDVDRVESEPLFAKIRSDAEFQKIQTKMHESEAVVQLPAMRVSAGLANIELRLFYLPNAGFDTTKPLSFLRVETVRRNSLAARAGVVEGMEIVAIQGSRIRGMTDADLNELMMRPAKNEIVFVAREYSNGPEREIHLPLPQKPPTVNEPALKN
jgi:membrane-associated protease RseP (regulator of RpoE activity)